MKPTPHQITCRLFPSNLLSAIWLDLNLNVFLPPIHYSIFENVGSVEDSTDPINFLLFLFYFWVVTQVIYTPLGSVMAILVRPCAGFRAPPRCRVSARRDFYTCGLWLFVFLRRFLMNDSPQKSLGLLLRKQMVCMHTAKGTLMTATCELVDTGDLYLEGENSDLVHWF